MISITDAGNLIHVLPADAEIEAVEYRSAGMKIVVTDGARFKLEINEFGADR